MGSKPRKFLRVSFRKHWTPARLQQREYHAPPVEMRVYFKEACSTRNASDPPLEKAFPLSPAVVSCLFIHNSTTAFPLALLTP